MRPIDLQDNLSKAPLAGREQAVQQASADFGQRHGAQALGRQRVLDLSRVKTGENAEGPENRVDRDGGNDTRQQSGDRDRQAPHDDEEQPDHRRRPAGFSRQIDVTA